MRKLREQVAALYTRRHLPAHDLGHSTRVAALARRISLAEAADADEAEAAGLLHDIGYLEEDQEGGHAVAGLPRARALLDACTSFPEDAKTRILSAIRQHSDDTSTGQLANLLHDADRIDMLGAVGLVRSYIYKGELPAYPDSIVATHGLKDGPTIGHFIAYQMRKIGLLHTATAREIAGPRHAFMEAFLAQLKAEVEFANQS
jgi:uncharacterized protein